MTLRHQLADADQRMSEVRATRDALQQMMLELTQELRSVLTDRHVEVSDDSGTYETEQQLTEMHTLRRQLDEQLAESLSRVSECSQLRSQRGGVTRSSRFPTEMRV